MIQNTFLLDEETNFLELLKKLDHAGNGFLVVIDQNNKLIGIVTDGDIRRAILNKKTESIADIINYSPLTASSNMSRAEVQAMLKSIKRRQIPVVDQDNTLTDIVYLEDSEVHYSENYVVIMAGGLGSRLGELTKEVPKPMLQVGGKPILERIILSFKEAGYNKFLLCLNYKAEVISQYFGDGRKFGVDINYNLETKKMGTAGALSLIKKTMKCPFFVVNGDILTTIQYQDFMAFHIKSKSIATMCVKTMDYQIPYACINVDYESNILGLAEKPIHEYKINAGLYILAPEVLRYIPQNEYFDMTTLFEVLINEKQKVVAYCHEEYWLDIGHKSDYYKANSDISI